MTLGNGVGEGDSGTEPIDVSDMFTEDVILCLVLSVE